MVDMYRLRVLAIVVALAAGSRVLLAAGQGDAAKGKAVFQQCGVCHRADSAEKKIGPGLKGLFRKAKLADGKKLTEASIRAKVEHPFHVVKNLFRHHKTRYKGLAKNTAHLFSLFGLANLFMARRWLLDAHTQGAS